MCKVVNLYKDPYTVYIGRAGKGKQSIFGNPFVVGKDGDLNEVLKKFKSYLWKKMLTEPEFCDTLLKLDGEVLGCFCKPKDCHGDIIVAAVNYLKEKRKK